MVIDDGWQTHPRAGGPWDRANERFGEMSTLAGVMRAHGVRAGIWFRPLLTRAPVPSTWLLPRPRPSDAGDRVLDPSVPEVLDLVAADMRRLTQWGFELVKHDFTTHDLLGAWSNEMGTRITQGNWSFADRSRTTAEIVRAFYETIRDAAGTALVLGCNVIGHLSAGLFALQRTGDDTSGSVWERTRVMGVNTLAFRIAQHGTFFAADADCAAVTKAVPWHLAEQWLRLLAQSGTPLFVSASPAAVGPAQEAAIRAAFALAAVPRPVAEPLDWLQTTCPAQWSTADGIAGFTWYDADGVETFR